MTISVKKISLDNNKEIKLFIDLPWKLYKDDPNWVPPLKMAVEDILNPQHPFYQTADCALWIAYDDNEIVGRIMATINHHHNSFHNERCGFFGFFESINNKDIAHQLLTTAKNWLTDNNMEQLRGPLNPSTNYESGLLISGFDDPPQIMMTHNPTYYADFFESFGLTKIKDLIAYQLAMDFTMPERITRIAARLEKSNRISYRCINPKKFAQEIDLMFKIYNDAWEKNWGFVPMTEEEFKHTAKDLKSILEKNLIQFVEVAGEAVGFAVGLPDYNQIFKRIPSGKLFPFGIFKLLFGKKHITRFRVITLGIKKDFAHLGLATLLYNQLYKEARKIGYTEGELSWILEDNKAMNAPLRLMGAKDYKYYRIYNQDIL